MPRHVLDRNAVRQNVEHFTLTIILSLPWKSWDADNRPRQHRWSRINPKKTSRRDWRRATVMSTESWSVAQTAARKLHPSCSKCHQKVEGGRKLIVHNINKQSQGSGQKRQPRGWEETEESPATSLIQYPHVQVHCCFTSTETVRTIRDGEPRKAEVTFTDTAPELWLHGSALWGSPSDNRHGWLGLRTPLPTLKRLQARLRRAAPSKDDTHSNALAQPVATTALYRVALRQR